MVQGRAIVGRSRLRPPRPSHAMVERTGLLQRWRAARPEVTVLHGPAGYGKTSTVLQFVEHEVSGGVPLAWLSLDALDNDPETLVRHLAQALEIGIPGFSATEVTELLDARGDHALDYAGSLIADGVERLSAPALLVLDDCHHLTNATGLSLVSELIAACTPEIRLILTSRGRLPLALSRFRMAGRLHEIDESELRLTTTEAGRVLSSDSGEASDSAALVEYANGWAVALRMMAMALADGTDPADLTQRIESGPPDSLGDFLAENVLTTLAEPLLTFLHEVAVCERISDSLAIELTSRPDAGQLLHEAAERSLFITQSAESASTYRIHQAFRDFLLTRLNQRAPDRVRQLHLNASTWYLGHGHYDEALEHALAVSADTAGELVQNHAMELVEDSKMAALIRLAGKLPPSQRDSRWRLTLAVAWANALLQRAAIAQVHLDHTRAAIGAGDASDEITAEIGVVQACIDIFQDRVDRIPELVGGAVNGNSRAFVVGVACNAQTVALLHAGELAQARKRQNIAHAFHLRSQGPFAGVYGRALAGLAALEQLDLRSAEVFFGEAAALAAEQSGRASHAAQLAHGLRGELCVELGADSEGMQLLQDALVLGADGGIVETLRGSFGTLARTYHLAGRDAEAEQLLDEGMTHASRLNLPRLQAELAVEAMRIHVAREDIHAARITDKILAELSDRRPTTATPLIDTPIAIGRSMCATALGESARSISILDRMRNAPLSPRRRLLVYAHLVAALEAGSRPSQARQLFGDVVRTAAAIHAVGTLRAAGAPLLLQASQLRDRIAERGTGHGHADLDLLNAVLAPVGVPAETPAPRRIATTPTPFGNVDHPRTPLNDRETEILECIEQGMTNQAVAEHLFLSVNTVKWHLKNAYQKLGTTSRVGAITTFRESRGNAPANPEC